jgi:hypothetical protein
MRGDTITITKEGKTRERKRGKIDRLTESIA